MSIDKKILSEIERYKSINNYIMEQGAPPPPPVPPTPGGDEGAVAPPPPPAGAEGGAPQIVGKEPEPIDVEADKDVEKIDDKGKSEEKGDKDEDSEELDVTDLVDSQKKIETKQEEYFQNLFSQLSNLESKLKDMDQIVAKLNHLENKIEKYREKSPQEKLDLRKYDSYPFNQKLSDFFNDKQDEFEKTGKTDYVLTSDDVTDISDSEIKDTFLPTEEDKF
jgi:hypothetical protein